MAEVITPQKPVPVKASIPQKPPEKKPALIDQVKEKEDGAIVKSLGAKLDRLIEVASREDKPTTLKVVVAQQGDKPKKSYAGKSYSEAEMLDDNRVSHPYDVDCPYCHNLKHSDMVAHQGRIRTEQSMKMNGDG